MFFAILVTLSIVVREGSWVCFLSSEYRLRDLSPTSEKGAGCLFWAQNTGCVTSLQRCQKRELGVFSELRIQAAWPLSNVVREGSWVSFLSSDYRLRDLSPMLSEKGARCVFRLRDLVHQESPKHRLSILCKREFLGEFCCWTCWSRKLCLESASGPSLTQQRTSPGWLQHWTSVWGNKGCATVFSPSYNSMFNEAIAPFSLSIWTQQQTVKLWKGPSSPYWTWQIESPRHVGMT